MKLHLTLYRKTQQNFENTDILETLCVMYELPPFSRWALSTVTIQTTVFSAAYPS